MIEAVVEVPQVKAAVFAELDRVLPATTVLASNASSIPVAQLAAATSRSDRVLGLHFFSPVVLYAVCDLLYEELKGDEYAPPPLLKRMAVAGRLGRKSGLGFYEYPAHTGRRAAALAETSA